MGSGYMDARNYISFENSHKNIMGYIFVVFFQGSER